MRKYIIYFVLFILLVPSILALLHPGFFVSDDGEWMIIRFSAFHQALRDGQFPVRFLSRLNFGYGYPVANFLYPGFMYLSEPIKLLGFGFVNTIKIILGLSLVSSALFCYSWLSKLFKPFPAILGALFYVYAPYHLYDVYTRGSVGEVLALAVVPFVLWQIERLSIWWISIGIGLLILSHNTLAVLFIPLIVLYMVLDIYVTKKEKIKPYLISMVLGFGLSAFFWIPAIYDLQYTIFSTISVSNFSTYFADQKLIGISTILIFLITFILFVVRKIEITKHRLTALLFIIGISSLFMSTGISLELWKLLPVSFIQFPFRFLSVSILCGAFLLACIISVLPKIKATVAIIFGILIIFSAMPFISPTQFINKGEGFYATNEATTTVKDEYLDQDIKMKPTEHFKDKVEIIRGSGNISHLSYNSKYISFDIRSNAKDTVFQINNAYFAGWGIYIDSKSTYYRIEPNGAVLRFIPEGNHHVELKFGETPVRQFGDILTIISLVTLVFISMRQKIYEKI